MRFLYLGIDSPVSEYLSFLGSVDITTEKINAQDISNYDWVISYGYRHIIKQDVIDAAKNPIINLHISYLPFNKGASPNYFSWLNDTPKGITIHQIDKGVDTGDIYFRKIVSFEESDTLATSYLKLKKEIEQSFSQIFPDIIDSKLSAFAQTGKGSLQYMRELPNNLDFKTSVTDISATYLQEVVLEDFPILLEWRNSEVVRKNSFNSDKIDRRNHIEYIERMTMNPQKNQFFYVVNGKKVSYIREDIGDNEIELSYVVDPNEHGKGYGTRTLAKYLEFKKGLFYLQIKDSNVASIRMAEYNGFELVSKKDNTLRFELEL